MSRHGAKRTEPAQLVPGTIRVICARMNYLPPQVKTAEILRQSEHAYIARYALGRDYHKLIRKRLSKLVAQVQALIGEFGFRAFSDSAPVMEKPLAEKAGLGWMGKHTNIINRQAGSWFFLGEIYTDLPLPIDEPVKNHCGKCQACLDVCPTQAIVGPYQLDARRCISYLTIENKGSIPEEFRSAMGNRIFGCDDCQLVCPWNRFAKHTQEKDFHPRHQVDNIKLIELFNWTEAEYTEKTRGSVLSRPKYEGWLRNIAVALGNAKTSPEIIATLQTKLKHPSALVREHVTWALQQHQIKTT